MTLYKLSPEMRGAKLEETLRKFRIIHRTSWMTTILRIAMRIQNTFRGYKIRLRNWGQVKIRRRRSLLLSYSTLPVNPWLNPTSLSSSHLPRNLHYQKSWTLDSLRTPLRALLNGLVPLNVRLCNAAAERSQN